MIGYLLRRLALVVPILLGVTLVVFLAIRLVPGDPARVMLGERANPTTLAEVRAELGLDRPLPVQFGTYLVHLARGDLGRSIATGEPVGQLIAERFPATVELGLAAMLIACAVGVPLGVVAAVRRNAPEDYLATAGSLAGVSMPIFWLGLLLMGVFSADLRWLPLSGRLAIVYDMPHVTGLYLVDGLLTGSWTAWVSALRHLVLPAVTLATVPAAAIARMTRGAMLDVLGAEHIRTARAKGLSEAAVTVRHALATAAIPIATVIGLQLGYLLSGAVITETVFSWPGVGSLAVEAVFARDLPLLQGCALVFAASFALVNLATDMLYFRLDPRIRKTNR